MSVKIDQAFVDAFIDADLGLDIAHENLPYTPTSGTEYVELINIPNDITPLSINDSDHTDGIFRIILHWPADEGAINAKAKADEILAAFKIGTVVSYDSQSARVTKTSRYKGIAEDGWYNTIITISYYAVLGR